jgi:nucleoside-diphosphate-sugar epimerase
MSKFFITGASGWLGKSLVNNIINGKYCTPIDPQNITAFCLPSEDIKFLSESGVNICQGDIRDIQVVNNFLRNAEDAVVIHLCGIIHPRLRVSDFFDINYLGTKHILRISQQVGVKKVVLMSSNSPIGCNKSNHDEDIFTEESPFNPYMKYGKSKYLLEKFAGEFTSHYENPKITIIRAPWFYGPYQPVRQTLFFKLIKEGKFPIIGNGENKRSMAYTDNLSQGIILAALSEKSNGQTYWIADKNSYTMNKIVATVRDVLSQEFAIQCKEDVIRMPSVVADAAYIADTILQNIGLYNQKIHVLSEMNKNIFCSIKKAEDDLGYRPEFDLYSGMKESIKWCLDNNIKI